MPNAVTTELLRLPAGDGIVLDGELTLIMDDGETLVRTGDIVIQRGTNHAWANRSGKNCRIVFILVDGKFDADIA